MRRAGLLHTGRCPLAKQQCRTTTHNPHQRHGAHTAHGARGARAHRGVNASRTQLTDTAAAGARARTPAAGVVHACRPRTQKLVAHVRGRAHHAAHTRARPRTHGRRTHTAQHGNLGARTRRRRPRPSARAPPTPRLACRRVSQYTVCHVFLVMSRAPVPQARVCTPLEGPPDG